MRKIILDLAVTLDGFIEGPNGEIDWCIMDEDIGFDKFLDRIDTIFYGRKSFDLWGEYQPDESASSSEIQLWNSIQGKVKYVFSRSQTSHSNKNVQIITGHIKDQIEHIRATEGKDIWLYGGAELITFFVNEDLVDEYRLAVHPVILGSGKSLFIDIHRRKNLHLSYVNQFKSGVVQLIYTIN
jgi:dihydrofolate reductase